MKEVLVTGATGFVGGHLAALLLTRGILPRLLVRRDTPDISSFVQQGARALVGDWQDGGFLREAVTGCDTVIHVAGATKRLTEADYLKDNCRFTEAILSHLSGDQRFIFLSSQAAAGPSTEGRPITEEDHPRPLTWYGKSKLAAEEAVRRWGCRNGDNYLILRPCSVFGPNEKDIFTYFKFMERGILLLLGDGTKRISIVYVKDLCDAILRAAESPLRGRAFFVANDEPVSWKELAEAIQRAMGKTRVFRIRIPEALAAPIGRLAGSAGRRFGRALPVNEQKVIEMKQPAWVCSNRAIKEALGWYPRYSLDNALAETVSWYRTHGWLRS